MNQLPPLGRTIVHLRQPTFDIYNQLLHPVAERIRSTPRKTFAYDAQHDLWLDVYYPRPEASPGESLARQKAGPILLFLYGGGLVAGHRRVNIGPPTEDLVYANVGHYFAQHGYHVVVMDYRLVPTAVYPSGGEDVDAALRWMESNIHEFNDGEGGAGGAGGGQRDVFVMGHSAGGVHLCTWLFGAEFAEARERVLQNEGGRLRLRGVVFLTVPFDFQAADESRAGLLEKFYGKAGGSVSERCPLALLTGLRQRRRVAEALPGVTFLLMTTELDPGDEILEPNHRFIAEWHRVYTSSTADASPESRLECTVIAGHNHISPTLGLGTGREDEEAWGSYVVDFCRRSTTTSAAIPS